MEKEGIEGKTFLEVGCGCGPGPCPIGQKLAKINNYLKKDFKKMSDIASEQIDQDQGGGNEHGHESSLMFFIPEGIDFVN